MKTANISNEMNKFYQASQIYYDELHSVANRKHYSPYFKYARLFGRKGSDFLDMGCGLGTIPYFFSQDGFNAYGVDVSPKFLSHSANSQTKTLHYVSGNVFGLPFKDEAFDIVGNYDVLEHIPDVEKFLSEGIRVLKKGGVFITISPSILTPFTPLKALFSFKRRHSIYVSKWNALISIFSNLVLIIKKKISKRTAFCYRRPMLDEDTWTREVDTVYQTSPIDIRRFLESKGMKILHYQNDGPDFLHKFVGRFLPDFASTIYIVAEKR